MTALLSTPNNDALVCRLGSPRLAKGKLMDPVTLTPLIAVTPLYAALCGLLLLILSIRVVAVVRAKGKLSLGDGGNPDFTPVIRAHGNFIEYVPIALILIAFAEAGGTSSTWIHTMGAALVIGRIAHPFGLSNDPSPSMPRFVGMILTWSSILAGSIFVLVNQLG
jgi:uncharacterized protein